MDPSCAACGELLYRIFQAMAISFTPEIAMLLYMAIATDTGCFVYSNTTPGDPSDRRRPHGGGL